MRSFKDYVDTKQKKVIKQLQLIGNMLEKSGLKVSDFSETAEAGQQPYIFVYNTAGTRFFDGVRIYSIGNKIAYRVQKEETTHPFGKAYSLDLEEMFNDFLEEENIDEKKAGKMIIEEVPQIMRRFFERSAKAEKEIETQEIIDKKDMTIGSTMGTDYSNMVYNKK